MKLTRQQIARMKDRPYYAVLYALNVLKGRLPDRLHNTMVLRSFETPDDAHIREYIGKHGKVTPRSP